MKVQFVLSCLVEPHKKTYKMLQAIGTRDTDIMHNITLKNKKLAWNAKTAKKKLMLMPNTLICDALLDQQIFSGVGNIIKNEVLYRVKIHPRSEVGKIPNLKLNQLIMEASNHSFDFLEWKREFVLKKHWLAHTKEVCLRCNLPIIKEYPGVFKRRSFFFPNCQKLYS